MHSHTELIQLLVTCLINPFLTDEIDVGYALVSSEALTSNYYHAGPFEMPSYNWTTCLWWKFANPLMLSTEVNSVLISIATPGYCFTISSLMKSATEMKVIFNLCNVSIPRMRWKSVKNLTEHL